MPEFNLKKLLQNIIPVEIQIEKKIFGLSTDSRAIKKGDLFIACVGETFDGRKYISEAVNKGAAAVLYEANDKMQIEENSGVPFIAVEQLKKYVGLIASRFYGEPTAQMNVVGITGTNGKTSCCEFIARSLQKNGTPCGMIGTLGMGFPDQLTNINLNLTTPDPITLQREFAALKQNGAKAIAMEVSSHSLVQQRVTGTHFSIAIFTNLTRDHMDYHKNMENYANAKRILFEMPGLRYAIINLDDAYGQKYLQQIPKHLKVYGYSIRETAASIPLIHADNIQISPSGFSARVKTPWGEGEIKSQLLGRFNLSNLLAVLTALNILEIPFEKTLQYLSTVPTVPGRMQVFGGNKQPIVVVDYAHTPDALEKALHALREHCAGKLWCVFGCGGERDKGKRPLMAEVAEKFSDHLIITDDNPRREDSKEIIAGIVQGLSQPAKAEIISNRAAAIAAAINQAQAKDVILIAGKGHEPYQIVGTEKFPFSDAEEVKKYLSRCHPESGT